MAIYQFPTGTHETRAAFAVSGGSLRDQRYAFIGDLTWHHDGIRRRVNVRC